MTCPKARNTISLSWTFFRGIWFDHHRTIYDPHRSFSRDQGKLKGGRRELPCRRKERQRSLWLELLIHVDVFRYSRAWVICSCLIYHFTSFWRSWICKLMNWHFASIVLSALITFCRFSLCKRDSEAGACACELAERKSAFESCNLLVCLVETCVE